MIKQLLFTCISIFSYASIVIAQSQYGVHGPSENGVIIVGSAQEDKSCASKYRKQQEVEEEKLREIYFKKYPSGTAMNADTGPQVSPVYYQELKKLEKKYKKLILDCETSSGGSSSSNPNSYTEPLISPQQQIQPYLSQLQAQSTMQLNAFSSVFSSVSGTMINSYITQDKASNKKMMQEEFSNLEYKLKSYGGSLINCQTCYGRGYYNCNECSSSGVKKCSSCKGDSGKTCSYCYGTGKVGPFGISCMNCYGQGKTKCMMCSNSGKEACIGCCASGNKFCMSCRGTGKKHTK